MKDQKIIYIIRFLHSIISFFFIFLIGCVYYFALTGKSSPWIPLIVAALVAEGVILLINRGECPLSFMHRKFGDDKKFFELFFPKKVAPYTGIFLGLISIIGFFLLWLNKH